MAISGGRTIPRGTTLTSDVCIVGGGPAGITLGRRLAASKLSVTLLESGGVDGAGEAQQLNQGEVTGLSYYELDATRFRGLGGGSHHWAGWCRPLDSQDMEPRPWVPLSGWPLKRADLDRYYEEAARVCELPARRFDPENGAGLPPLYRAPFIGGDVAIAGWQGSPPTKFGIVFRDDLTASSQLTVLTDATAVSVLTDDGGERAAGVAVATLDGNRFEVRSRVTVLCAGAFETPRLLLVSKPGGLGNEHDLVGRYFMEHPHLVTGTIELFPPDRRSVEISSIDRGFGGIQARLRLQRPSGDMKVAYVISDERRRSDELLAFSTHLQTISPIAKHDSDAYQAMKLVLSNLRSPRRFFAQIRAGTLPAGVGELTRRIVRGLPEVTAAMYQEAVRKPKQFALYTQAEQSPNRESRVTLSPDRADVLGMPRIRLDWRLSELDKDSIIRSQEIVGERLTATGVGRLVPTEPFQSRSADWGPELRGGHHHLGTARMAQRPENGVVDRDQRVHTVRDLYIGDSSVFPTGGFANPMLTSVALALRLGDHLGGEYGT
jgi:choline dehydrogenase-like flavoprotein